MRRREAGVAALVLLLGACSNWQDATVAACLEEELRPASFAAGDIDGDGQADLAVGCSFANGPASSAPGRVEVLAGDGGSFGEPLVVREFDYGVTGMALRDLTGDGRPELLANVSGSHERVMAVIQQRPAGEFREIARATTRTTMSAPALVDLDDDGDVDVVMPDDNLKFRNDGTAARPGPFVESRFVAINERNRVGVGELDGDGHADAVHLVTRRGKLRLYATAGGSPEEIVLGKDVRRLREVQAGSDLDADGRLELLASAHDGADEGSWLMVHAAEVGWQLTPVLEDLEPSPGLHLGDLDGDGLKDLVAEPRSQPGEADYQLRVARGRGDGTFEPAETWPTASFPYRPALVDVNGDGRRDVIFLDLQAHLIRLITST